MKNLSPIFASLLLTIACVRSTTTTQVPEGGSNSACPAVLTGGLQIPLGHVSVLSGGVEPAAKYFELAPNKINLNPGAPPPCRADGVCSCQWASLNGSQYAVYSPHNDCIQSVAFSCEIDVEGRHMRRDYILQIARNTNRFYGESEESRYQLVGGETDISQFPRTLFMPRELAVAAASGK